MPQFFMRGWIQSAYPAQYGNVPPVVSISLEMSITSVKQLVIVECRTYLKNNSGLLLLRPDQM